MFIRIYTYKNRQVVFDADIAETLKHPTKYINQVKKRNQDQFTKHHVVQMSKEEWKIMRKWSQSKRTYPPYLYTAKGILMLATRMHNKSAKWVLNRMHQQLVSQEQAIFQAFATPQRINSHPIKLD
jgi:hypothetical protein